MRSTIIIIFNIIFYYFIITYFFYYDSRSGQNIKYINMKLDENERSTQIRLMKVKDMMLEEAIEERRAADEQ